MMIRLTISFIIATALANHGQSQDQSAKANVDLLVMQLVSPNSAPRISAASAKYPENYDKKAQDKIFRSYYQLCDMGTSAFPYLFEHFSDQRYSLTADGGASDVNFTVGRLCYAGIDLQLQPYKTFTNGNGDARERARRPHYASSHKFGDLKSAQNWWTLHQSKSLRDLQIEVLQWIASEEGKDKSTYGELERGFIDGTLDALRNSGCALRRGSPWAL